MMTTLLAEGNPFIQVPVNARFWIGFFGIFHVAVASLSIGSAAIVTTLQIVAYRRNDIQYDTMAKRIQLWHVCMYNIGTIVAIGLVFALSGLYPQFWSQAFVQFFWTLIVEELLFFMLATTLTLHYFFWDTMWGHKKLHIFLGALLNPMFFLQFFIINGISGYMLTPGFADGQVSNWSGTVGVLGWDKLAFYNPSFLMLTFHRTAANIAYGGFFFAGVCGVWLYRQKNKSPVWFENGARLIFQVAFTSFLLLPVIGFFYSWVLKYHATGAYENLMIGRGDVIAGGVNWWWLKQLCVAVMIGIGLVFSRRAAKTKREFVVAPSAVYTIALLYLMFYLGMATQMTWRFFWGPTLTAVLAGMWAVHLLNRHNGSGKGVFIAMAILSFLTVCLGGYVREASRPRFVSPSGENVPGFNRIPAYSSVYHDEERPELMTIRMVHERPDYVDDLPGRLLMPDPDRWTPADMVSQRCISCHTLERVHRYKGTDWDRVVGRMRAYGIRPPISDAEALQMVAYLQVWTEDDSENK